MDDPPGNKRLREILKFPLGNCRLRNRIVSADRPLCNIHLPQGVGILIQDGQKMGLAFCQGLLQGDGLRYVGGQLQHHRIGAAGTVRPYCLGTAPDPSPGGALEPVSLGRHLSVLGALAQCILILGEIVWMDSEGLKRAGQHKFVFRRADHAEKTRAGINDTNLRSYLQKAYASRNIFQKHMKLNGAFRQYLSRKSLRCCRICLSMICHTAAFLSVEM